MRFSLAVAVPLVVALAAVSGCASAPSRPTDVLAAMDRELAHAIGTTTVTSAELTGLAPIFAAAAMELPEDRMSLSQLAPAPVQTWGATAELASVPDTRE